MYGGNTEIFGNQAESFRGTGRKVGAVQVGHRSCCCSSTELAYGAAAHSEEAEVLDGAAMQALGGGGGGEEGGSEGELLEASGRYCEIKRTQLPMRGIA
eukprot:981141-Rhodomonas_salina.2